MTLRQLVAAVTVRARRGYVARSAESSAAPVASSAPAMPAGVTAALEAIERFRSAEVFAQAAVTGSELRMGVELSPAAAARWKNGAPLAATVTDSGRQVGTAESALDPGFGTLIDDLNQRGLLDTTLVLWMGEFGRTPEINANTGRDHFPIAWSSVMAGGGIKGGQVVGKTAADGMTVEDRPVPMADYLATVCLALGLDPTKQNMSNVGRPIRLADPAAKAITEIVG